ncbi:MAG: hypothetical protein V4812_10795 [Pseudomonadota bacterium]
MLNPEWTRSLLGLGLGLCLLPAQACGPDFPLRLLDNRAQTLAELPEHNFAFEVRRLAGPIPGLKLAITVPDYWDQPLLEGLEQRDQVEQNQLPEPQRQLVQRLRLLQDARQAEHEGAELPAELRLYSAGAVAFAQDDHDLAIAYFQRVLALPAAERPLRSTWAAYSLGRVQAARSVQSGLPAGAAQDAADAERLMQESATAARRSFQQVRHLAIEGFSDPLELGIASLGEEARVDLDQSQWASAIRLYASQYQQGSHSGYVSLELLAQELARMPEPELIGLLRDLEVQQLLTAHLITHAGWLYGEQPAGEKRLVDLLQRSDIANLANADRLAALSYQAGRYDSAAAFLAQAGDNGLTWWLRAKLALRAGDKVLASTAYAQAAKAFPADEDWGSRRTANWDMESVQPRCRVEGESALLALERGDYLEAFDQLYRSGWIYWQDSAVVAERVLTLDELKGYVDAQVDAPPPATQAEIDSHAPRPVAAHLRELLGRRLLRAERYEEAVAYFDDPALRQAALEYGEARKAGADRWRGIDRAEALYGAAVLARRQGMELLGYEMAPDHAYTGGTYSLDWVERQVPGDWLSAAEATRQNDHLAQPNRRYHYRYVAADLASQAADQLPPRSQAFAATLCKAGGWLVDSDLDSARVHYRRYNAEGAYLPWMANFGRNCQEPDFDRARERLWHYRTSAARQWLGTYGRQLGLGLGLAVGLAGLWHWRRKREHDAP